MAMKLPNKKGRQDLRESLIKCKNPVDPPVKNHDGHIGHHPLTPSVQLQRLHKTSGF